MLTFIFGVLAGLVLGLALQNVSMLAALRRQRIAALERAYLANKLRRSNK
jgi:hypothetical protein